MDCPGDSPEPRKTERRRGARPIRAPAKKAKSNFVLAFFNEAHLRRMKNEAVLRPVKHAFGIRRGNVVLKNAYFR